MTETFIQAHREIPGMKVSFYFGGIQHARLEGVGSLLDLSLGGRLKKKVINPLAKFGLTATEEAIAESFLKKEIQCILAEYGPSGVMILPIAKALDIPLVVHFHGYDAVRKDVILDLKADYDEMFEYASAIIAVSKAMREKLIALGCPEEKVILNTYGPHPDFEKVDATLQSDQFVGVGRFTDKKAPYYTILAFKEVLQKFPNARLIIGGDGSLYDACLNLTKYHNIDHAVSLPGAIQREDYIDLLKNARAFVQHSITPSSGDMEGTPLSVLEAQAAGVPVISTRHAGIPDVVLEGETGLLSEEHDVASMAKHMIQLLENKTLAVEMGKKGKERVDGFFRRDRHLKVLGELILRAIY